MSTYYKALTVLDVKKVFGHDFGKCEMSESIENSLRTKKDSRYAVMSEDFWRIIITLHLKPCRRESPVLPKETFEAKSELNLSKDIVEIILRLITD